VASVVSSCTPGAYRREPERHGEGVSAASAAPIHELPFPGASMRPLMRQAAPPAKSPRVRERPRRSARRKLMHTGVVQIIAPAVPAISETALVAWCSYSPLCERVRAFDTPPDESRRFSGYGCGTPRRWRLTGLPGPTVRWSVRRGFVERPYKYPFSPGARKRQERHRRIHSAIKPSIWMAGRSWRAAAR
jgi:hypothetical protein